MNWMSYVEELFEELLEKISLYNPDFNEALITKAFQFALKAHQWQERRSGEPYIIHTVHTALNLTRLNADDVSIVCGLLHDVPEDTPYTIDDIQNEFGEDVASIIEWITKLSKVYYTQDMAQRDIDYLKKVFISFGKDIRVILVKICDRLHNLRTLNHLPEHKRYRIAKETLEVYVPVIHLLSIGEFIGEFEDLCLKYVDPVQYKLLSDKFEKLKSFYENKIQQIESRIKKVLGNDHIDFKIYWRLKSLYSIYSKMKKKNIPLDMVFDVLAFRIVTKSIKDCYIVLWVVHGQYKIKGDKFKDYISSPKNNWYQSIHTTVFDHDWDFIEFQILAEDMAKLNKFWLASHYIYKNFNASYGETPYWVKSIIDLQKESTDSNEFFDKLKSEILSLNIQCYTPKWKQIELPKWSTVLDFAYKIHSDLWDKLIWAYINWNYTPDPIYKLNNGDVVNIKSWDEINKNFSIEYISIVKTNTARDYLRKIFASESEEKRIKLGKYLLDSRLDVMWRKSFETFTQTEKNKIITKFSAANVDQFYYNIWIGKIDIDKLTRYIVYLLLDNKNLKKVCLKVYTKMHDYTMLASIIDIFKNLSIKLDTISYNKAYILIEFFIQGYDEFQELLMELRRAPNILEIKRIFPLRLWLFNWLLGVISLLILFMFPLLLLIFKFPNVEKLTFLSQIGYLLGEILLISTMYYYNFMFKDSLPNFLNWKYFWLFVLISSVILYSYLLTQHFMLTLIPYFNFLALIMTVISIVSLIEYIIHIQNLWHHKK